MANAQIGALFLGGLAVGLMSVAAYTALIVTRIALNPKLAPRGDERYGLAGKVQALRETWPIILLMVGVMGGLFAGVMTPTEAGAAGAFIAFVIAAARRTLTWSVFKNALLETDCWRPPG